MGLMTASRFAVGAKCPLLDKVRSERRLKQENKTIPLALLKSMDKLCNIHNRKASESVENKMVYYYTAVIAALWRDAT